MTDTGETEQARKLRLKREKLAKVESETKRKRLAAAGVDADPRTAMGRRHFDVIGTGRALRASVNHFNRCFARKSDRTDTRIVAWADFDKHMHKVKAGEIAAPRYEAGVDSSTTPGVADARLDALREDARMRAFLGADYHDLLVAVIYHQRTFSDLSATPDEARFVGHLFHRAVYILATFWNIRPDNERGRSLSRALWKATTREQD